MQLENMKCKNCGAQLDISKAIGGVVECEYCHSKHTLAKSTDVDVVNFLAMGEHCLDTGKFDEAYSAFNKAVNIDKSEPEAYFGMALAANKVRYIKDVKNNCLQPICYEATKNSFASDANYKKAASLAAVEQKSEYKRRASEIDYIRKEFYSLKQSGIEYDCFICVKVTDENGRKTVDSERANDIYYHLKDKGYRPFYSEREIQNETGADYEARILYALFSSPCMLVICSDESYLQTPWVKNEYSRFISLINDEQKEANSIAIGFFDKPIERLPNRNGRLQGVCLKNPDAYSKIVDFVDKHYNLNAEAPQISRKVYGQVAHQKRAAVKSQIQKRTLAKFEQTAISVSEQAKLDIAKSMLDGGNFNAAIARCNSILETNKSCALAYWYLFLAENGCKTGAEFENSTKSIDSFESFESAIASGDAKLRDECYSVLFNRAKVDRQLHIYDEYISLPDSKTENIKELTSLVYKDLIDGYMSRNSYKVFEAIIKTIDDTDAFIEMNLGFADKVFELMDGGIFDVMDKYYAVKCYKSVIEVEAGNNHALWGLFRLNHNLNTSTDVAFFLEYKGNHAKVEQEVFSYGFNAYAVEKMLDACMKSCADAGEHNVTRFDFIFSLIPQKEKALYEKCINEVTNTLLSKGEFASAARYNDMLIAEDKYNDAAYFNRLYIIMKRINPFGLAEECDSLYDVDDFSAAIDAYAEKHPKKQNIYIDLVNGFKTLHSLGFDFSLFEDCILNEEGLAEPISKTVNELVTKLADIVKRSPQDYNAIFDAVNKTGYYSLSVRDFTSVKLFKDFFKLLVTDEQIDKGKKCYDDKYGYGKSYSEYARMVESLKGYYVKNPNDKKLESSVNTTFAALKSLISSLKSGRLLTNDDYCLIAHIYLHADCNDTEIVSRVLLKIKGEFGTREKFRQLTKDAVGSDVIFERLMDFKQVQYTLSKNKKAVIERAPLTSIEIPGSVTEIESNAFDGFSSLSLVKIENGVKKIGEEAFADCSALKSIEIPDSVTEIGEGSFYNCKNLTEIKIGSGVKKIGDEAFSKCSALKSIEIPDCVTEIGSWVFMGCKNLAEVKIVKGVKTIGEEAFANCSSLKSIEIPDCVTEIGKKAFTGCALTGIEIPDSVTEIGEEAFSGCKNLVVVKIGNGVEKISAGEFFGCSALTGIEIPDCITEIGEEAFFSCSNLAEVKIGKGVKTISNKAFSGCTALKSLVIPDSVNEIGEEAFFSCSNLAEVKIGKGVKTISNKAFFCCSALTGIEIPACVTEIGNEAFAVTGLSNVIIPKRYKKERFRIFGEKQKIKRIKFKFVK